MLQPLQPSPTREESENLNPSSTKGKGAELKRSPASEEAAEFAKLALSVTPMALGPACRAAKALGRTTHGSMPWTPSLAWKNRVPFTLVRRLGKELAGPGRISWSNPVVAG